MYISHVPSSSPTPQLTNQVFPNYQMLWSSGRGLRCWSQKFKHSHRLSVFFSCCFSCFLWTLRPFFLLFALSFPFFVRPSDSFFSTSFSFHQHVTKAQSRLPSNTLPPSPHPTLKCWCQRRSCGMSFQPVLARLGGPKVGRNRHLRGQSDGQSMSIQEVLMGRDEPHQGCGGARVEGRAKPQNPWKLRITREQRCKWQQVPNIQTRAGRRSKMRITES